MYLHDEAGQPYNAETFDHWEYLSENVPDTRMLKYPEGRRALTRMDPMMFALIYCRDLITGVGGEISFSDLHLELCRTALTWVLPAGPQESRHAFIAPRGCGKSTFAFKILPMWAACHGHLNFIAAFSHSATQAQTHLLGFKRMLDTNLLIQEDYPELCEPARRANGNSIADSQEMYYAKSRFCIAAKGLDSGVLGLVDPENNRPDAILLDDVEPDESNYTPYKAAQRLTTICDTIFPMNINAHITLVGTVTMPDSIVHELVKSVVFPEEPVREWVKFEKFKVHYIKPIITKEDGTRRSVWPGKWSLEWLETQERSRSFKKNFLNLPLADGDEYWSDEDFRYAEFEDATRVLLQIDPAVTSKRTSDYTAFAVIAYRPPRVEVRDDGEPVSLPGCCEVRDIIGVRKPPEQLREVALQLLQRYPEIGAIRIEVNQGGETWKSVFKDMPVRILVHNESVPKKVRAMHLLNFYQNKQVYHKKPFHNLEDQMRSFPNVHHDDLIDAVGAGVYFFLKPKKKMSGRTSRYR
jgi:phage terminase large subunit-like protein